MNVIYAVNSEYINLLLVSLKSLKDNNPKIENIYILNSNLSYEDINKIRTISGNNVKFLNVDGSLVCKLVGNVYLKDSYFSKEIFYRLLIPKLVNQSIDKILYLDVDTIITSTLSELFEIDISKFPLAAVPYASIKKEKLKKLNIKFGQNYFNSGVLLLNLNYIRKNEIFDITIKNLIRNERKYNLPDQDALNSTLNGNFYPLDEIYNYTPSNAKKFKFKSQVKIVHFVGEFKPNICFYKHPFKKIFMNYYKEIELIDSKCILNRKYLIMRFRELTSIRYHLSKIKLFVYLKRRILREESQWIKREH